MKFSRTPFLQNPFRRILLFLICLTVSFCECILYYISKHKHQKSCFVNARILESFYKKGKKIKKENEKVTNWKLRKIVNLGNLGKVIPSFLFSEFLILAVGAVFDLKILKTFFRDFRDFWGFRVFGLVKKKVTYFNVNKTFTAQKKEEEFLQ